MTNETDEGLPARVRNAAAWVALHARIVRVNEDKIDAYAAFLLDKYPVIATLDAHTHLVDETSPARTAAYVLALDSINFGSGCFYAARQAGVPLEYETVAKSLRDAFVQGVLDAPEKWAHTTAQECHAVFNIPRGAHTSLDTLMDDFARHLQDTGAHVREDFNGNVLSLLEAANGSAARLAGIVGAWAGFCDEAAYKDRTVPFYKRAQIFAADIFLAFQGRTPAAFTDIAALTIFADNMVPHVLRHDGILSYAPDLAARIDAGEFVVRHSLEETELRAASIHAAELITQAAKRQGHAVCAMNIDHILWNRGYEAALYAQPRHMTITDCY